MTESDNALHRDVSTRCPNMKHHEANGLPMPCPSCYSIESIWRAIPYEKASSKVIEEPPKPLVSVEGVHNVIALSDYRTLLTAELGLDRDGKYDDGERTVLEEGQEPTLVSSERYEGPERVGQDDDGKRIHYPAIDLDFPCVLVASSTPGHHHLYLNRGVEWAKYEKLLEVLAECRLIEDGYFWAAKKRKATHLRVPGLKKREPMREPNVMGMVRPDGSMDWRCITCGEQFEDQYLAEEHEECTTWHCPCGAFFGDERVYNTHICGVTPDGDSDVRDEVVDYEVLTTRHLKDPVMVQYWNGTGWVSEEEWLRGFPEIPDPTYRCTKCSCVYGSRAAFVAHACEPSPF